MNSHKCISLFHSKHHFNITYIQRHSTTEERRITIPPYFNDEKQDGGFLLYKRWRIFYAVNEIYH